MLRRCDDCALSHLFHLFVINFVSIKNEWKKRKTETNNRWREWKKKQPNVAGFWSASFAQYTYTITRSLTHQQTQGTLLQLNYAVDSMRLSKGLIYVSWNKIKTHIAYGLPASATATAAAAAPKTQQGQRGRGSRGIGAEIVEPKWKNQINTSVPNALIYSWRAHFVHIISYYIVV